MITLKNIASYLSAFIFESPDKELSHYTLGTAFKMIDGENSTDGTILYPILYDNSIENVAYLSKNEDGYSITVSSLLAKELQQLRENHGDEAITFYAKDETYYYEVNDEYSLLYKNPISNESTEELISFFEQEKQSVIANEPTQIVDSNHEKNYDVKPSSSKLSSTISNSTGIRINWKINETQGKNQWCAAYAASMILNNKNDVRPTTVSQIANYAKVNSQQGISDSKIIQYANTRKVYPKYVNRVLSRAEVLTEIRKSNSVYGGWSRPKSANEGGGLGWHALDIIGLFSSSEFYGYWIWNPWYNYIELVDSSKSKIVYNVPGRQYTWKDSITNW